MVLSDLNNINSPIDVEMAAINVSDPDSGKHVQLVAKMASRCSAILAELEEFQSYLEEKRMDSIVYIKGLKKDLETILKKLEALPLDDSERFTLYLRCTNIPFLEAVWTVAKRSIGVTQLLSMTKRRHLPDQLHRHVNKVYIEAPVPKLPLGTGQFASAVDIVARNELEWVKVSTITERRVLFDLAKSGWVDGDTSDDEVYSDSDGLLKVAVNLVKVAKTVRVRYRNPAVRLVLPRIWIQDCHKEVMKVLQKIKDLGVIVETAEDMPLAPIPIIEARDSMAPDLFDGFSNTLNIDTTVLLAFVSDLSHDNVETKDWHQPMVAHQIRMERNDQMLPSLLWPACGSRKLVCTREAADRALEIVATIATETERKRMSLLLNVDPKANRLTPLQRILELQKLSKYEVPSDWQLPIEVIDIDLENIKSKLPSVAEKVLEILRGVNTSIFLFGWWSGYTTVSSNRTIAKDIENAVEGNRIGDEIGPHIWLTPSSRSLVGKEKERRGAIPEDARYSV